MNTKITELEAQNDKLDGLNATFDLEVKELTAEVERWKIGTDQLGRHVQTAVKKSIELDDQLTEAIKQRDLLANCKDMSQLKRLRAQMGIKRSD